MIILDDDVLVKWLQHSVKMRLPFTIKTDPEYYEALKKLISKPTQSLNE